MTPATFPQVNTNLGPPKELDESQCATIPAYVGGVRGGAMDGAVIGIVAWQPSAEELQQLNEGNPVFIGFIGGVVPHFCKTEFPV